ncbi:MAG: hypothetical protein JW725_04815 [Candidatus Babeliaceae bacterium]|nr:hypothetical protein [Candidatus Babeliaceae bacterium]
MNKNYSSRFIFFAIILGTFAQISAESAKKNFTRIEFKTPILSIVDRAGFLNVGEIVVFAQNLALLMMGNQNKENVLQIIEAYELEIPSDLPLDLGNEGKNRYAIILYDNAYYTAQELVQMEQDGTTDPEKIHDALLRAAEHFEKFSVQYVQQIQVAKSYMIPLIEQWSMLRNRPNTELLRWSKMEGGEQDALRKNLTTFKAFDTFLSDLRLFLADLLQNCPNSLRSYKNSMKR